MYFAKKWLGRLTIIPLHSSYWSIHTKDESKRGTAFAFIFGVNWLWRCGVTASFGVFFLEIRCNGMTSFMEFMTSWNAQHVAVTSSWQRCLGPWQPWRDLSHRTQLIGIIPKRKLNCEYYEILPRSCPFNATILIESTQLQKCSGLEALEHICHRFDFKRNNTYSEKCYCLFNNFN